LSAGGRLISTASINEGILGKRGQEQVRKIAAADVLIGLPTRFLPHTSNVSRSEGGVL
jgi:hypothetical protein